MNWLLRHLRVWAYQRGHRPKPGALLYSPSLDMIYGWRDNNSALGETWGFRKLRGEDDDPARPYPRAE